MLIPGWLIVMFFYLNKNKIGIEYLFDNVFLNIKHNNLDLTSFDIECVRVLFISIFSYATGLIWNSFMDIVFKGFRNNIREIYKAYIVNPINEGNDRKIRNQCPLNFCECRLSICKILCNYIHIVKDKIRGWFSCGPDKNNINMRIKYLDAYYYVMKNTYNSDIGIIEGQVAFIRNLILITPLYTYSFKNILCMHWACFSIIPMTVLFLTMVSRQRKIYKRIWEDNKLLHRCMN